MRGHIIMLLTLGSIVLAFAVGLSAQSEGAALAPPDPVAPPEEVTTQEALPASSVGPRSLSPRSVLQWLWDLGDAKEKPLARATLFSVAFLVALLTVLATWEVSPRSTSQPPPRRRSEGDEAPAQGAEAATPPAQEVRGSGLLAAFQGNFGRTVASGLGGMVAVTFVDDSFWSSGVGAKAHYVVLYVAFFSVILLTFAVFRGLVEVLRSRVALVYQMPARSPRRLPSENESRLGAALARIVESFGFLLRRLWCWVLSWQTPILLFCDTVFNVIQGRNQLQSAGFHRAIVDLHWSQVWAAQRLRDLLDDAVVAALKRPHSKGTSQQTAAPDLDNGDIRVAVSLLNRPRQSLFYIARERGSLSLGFSKRSLAWIAAEAGVARWLKKGARDAEPRTWDEVYEKGSAELLRAQDRPVSLSGTGPVLLRDWLQDRPPSDYEAFVVLPIPWSRRGDSDIAPKAALHISFRKAGYMDALWEGLERDEEGKPVPNYRDWKKLLSCPDSEPRKGGSGQEPTSLKLRDPVLEGVLQQALEVLGEMLRHFNPRVFEEEILPHLQH